MAPRPHTGRGRLVGKFGTLVGKNMHPIKLGAFFAVIYTNKANCNTHISYNPQNITVMKRNIYLSLAATLILGCLSAPNMMAQRRGESNKQHSTATTQNRGASSQSARPTRSASTQSARPAAATSRGNATASRPSSSQRNATRQATAAQATTQQRRATASSSSQRPTVGNRPASTASGTNRNAGRGTATSRGTNSGSQLSNNGRAVTRGNNAANTGKRTDSNIGASSSQRTRYGNNRGNGNNRGDNRGNGNNRGDNRGNGNMGNNHGGNNWNYGNGGANTGRGGNDRNYGNRRPGGNDRNYGNHRPGGNDRDMRPGGNGRDMRPRGNYDQFRYRDGFRPRPGNDRFYHSYRAGWHTPMRPPHRPHRPTLWFYRPTIPVAFAPITGAPVVDGILGLFFGTVYSSSLDYLYYNGYTIDGYYDNMVYLRDVDLYGYSWPDVQLQFDPTTGLSYAQFAYSTATIDRYRYNRLYSDLCATYGQPVAVMGGNFPQVTWVGGDSRGFVTLSLNNAGGRFYTSLSFGY